MGAPSSHPGPPGALIELDGTLNFRDLGGWVTADGRHQVTRGVLYRSDRLSDLSDDDHAHLEQLGIETVVDLRYDAEAAQHPSRLWATVRHHLRCGMGGELADQRSFIERALDGDYDGITDADVGESYVDLLTGYASSLGAAVEAILVGGPGLFHCTAGKDRTGLLAMLILRTVGVAVDDVLTDFALSNPYRAERRIAQLAPVFAARGLDIESFRPALSAPPVALERAMAWIEANHGSAARFLLEAAGVDDPVERLTERVLEPATDTGR